MITTLIAITNTVVETAIVDYMANFKVTDKDHVHVYYIDVVSGEVQPEEELTQVLVFSGTPTGEYKVNAITETGFNVELGAAYDTLTGRKLSIRREVPMTQAVDYPPGNDFPGATHERALDKLTAIVQEFNERVVRQLGLPLSEEATDLLLPAYISNYYLGLDGDDNLIWKVGTVAVGNDEIKDSHIDWGTGAGQVSAADMPIADAGSIITATEIEGALQENRTALDLNTAHAAGDGSSHGFINQDVKVTAIPDFAGIKIDGDEFVKIPTVVHQLGNTLTIASIAFPAIAELDSTHIAVFDFATGDTTAYVWDGSDWTQEGNASALVSGSAQQFMCRITDNLIAVADLAANDLQTYSWDGSDFATVGSAFSLAGSLTTGMTALSATSIALVDSGLDTLGTYDWNGSVWLLSGSTLSLPCDGPDIGALDSTTIAYVDGTEEILRIYEWTGSTWAAVAGSDFPVPGSAVSEIISFTADTFIMVDNIREVWESFYWDGVNITKMGGELPTGSIGVLGAAKMGTDKVAIVDANLDLLTTNKVQNYLIGK